MIAVPASALGLIKARGKRLASCFRIERTDGVVLRFTSSTREIEVNGEIYSPQTGVAASAQRKEAGLATHDSEFIGIISDDRITTEDLLAKRYDDAEVIEYLVDWQFPFAGPIASERYWIDGATFNGESWTAPVTGITRRLETKVGDKYTRTCRHKLGDSGCGISLGSFTVTGVTVLGMLDGEKRRIIRATTGSLSGTYADNWFAWGSITGTSGANNGITRDVKSYAQATRDIKCQTPFPFAIAAGDTFTLIAGCNGLKSTCVSKFSNVVNFGGFEFIPGSDEVLRVRP